MFGLFFEVCTQSYNSVACSPVAWAQNGPIQIQNDYSAKPNKLSFDKLADYFWIDQPVCVTLF